MLYPMQGSSFADFAFLQWFADFAVIPKQTAVTYMKIMKYVK